MLRNLSYTCFGLALSVTLVLKSFELPEEWFWFAVFCVGLTVILTCLMPIRFMGFAGVCGFVVVFRQLDGGSIPAMGLVLLAAALLASGVILATCADLPHAGNSCSGEPLH